MEGLIFRRNAKEGTVNLWLFNRSLIIDLWIKGFAITVFNLLYKLNSTAINLRNFPEYLQSFHAVSHFRVAFRKEKACKIIFFILPIWSTRPLKLMSSRSERGFVSDWRSKRSRNTSGKWAQVRDDHGFLINNYMIISKMFEYQIAKTILRNGQWP